MTDRPRGFRPLEVGFRGDVKWALAVMAGAGLGALLFGDAAVLVGAAVGVIVIVVSRAIRRRISSS